MNRPPEEFRRIAEKDLLAFATASLQHAGMPGNQASLLARCLVNSDLRGVRSRGTRTLGGYCGALKGGVVNTDPEIRVLKETDVAIQIDGGGGLGYSPMMMATEAAIRKARVKGVAVGAACNIGHYGSAGHYVRRAMEEGCTAFSVQGSYPQYYDVERGKAGDVLRQPAPQLRSAERLGATCRPRLRHLHHGRQLARTGVRGAGNPDSGGVLQVDGVHREAEIPSRQARRHGLGDGHRPLLPAEDFRHGIDEIVRLAREQMVPLQGYDETTLPGVVEDRLEKDQRESGIRIGTEDAARLDELATETEVAIDWT